MEAQTLPAEIASLKLSALSVEVGIEICICSILDFKFSNALETSRSGTFSLEVTDEGHLFSLKIVTAGEHLLSSDKESTAIEVGVFTVGAACSAEDRKSTRLNSSH
jgi:hypothetical protein